MVSVLIAIGMDFLVGLLFTFTMAVIAYSQRKFIKRYLRKFLEIDDVSRQENKRDNNVRRN